MADALDMPAWNAAVREMGFREACTKNGLDDQGRQDRVLAKFFALRTVFREPLPELPDWKDAMILRMQLYVLGTLIHDELHPATRLDS